MARDTVLITGVSRGIGLAIAQRLHRSGCKVVGLSRGDPPSAFEGVHRAVDLTAAGAKAQLTAICEEFAPGRLVANAGIALAGSLQDVTDADFETTMRLNLQSVIWAMQAATPAMRRDGFGRIVAIGSRAALGKRERIAYSASKAALSGLVRTAALELGEHAITVNIVAPGPTETEMFASHQPEGSPARAAIVANTAVRRMGQPDEIAAAVAYFLSSEAGFTTGQTLNVCGGMSIGAAR